MTQLIQSLCRDWREALLLGRIDFGEGPTPVLLRDGQLFDISREAATSAEALSDAGRLADLPGRSLGSLEALDLRPAFEAGPDHRPRLLAPVDLQCLKASGVTFAISAIERVIEERAKGRADDARAIRDTLRQTVGGDLSSVEPGSKSAEHLKQALIADGLWSQYLEVAIGPDAEIFTKGPPLSAVGWGDFVGVRSDSRWNNPEPEIALACTAQGEAVGATLGNDVNLRDFEGRSALLLGKAKDNNASCALGPFIRIFDDGFSIDDVRRATVRLQIEGEDGFTLSGESSMDQISRDPLSLVKQAIGEHHQYPDGFILMLGTMFAPIEDRDAPGQGFTHKRGDRVTVESERLGRLENTVVPCHEAPPWRFGIGELMHNLAGRSLIGTPS